jgi:hypothetical protein
MTPINALTQATDSYTAATVIAALKAAGYIIVKADAIKLAQREAVANYREDNDNDASNPYRHGCDPAVIRI